MTKKEKEEFMKEIINEIKDSLVLITTQDYWTNSVDIELYWRNYDINKNDGKDYLISHQNFSIEDK